MEQACSVRLDDEYWNPYTGRMEPRWAAFEVGLVVSRQNGKGSLLEARELAGLFLFGERLIIHSAHQFDTSKEAFERILMLVENTPSWKPKFSGSPAPTARKASNSAMGRGFASVRVRRPAAGDSPATA
ncbi:hypothetical protein [Streptomyces nigrescens]